MYPNEILIGNHTPSNHPDLRAGFRGLVPRTIVDQPVGYSAAIPPAEIKTFARDEMVRMIAEMEASQSRISDILLRGNAGQPIPSTDQNGQGYCAAYGPVGALQAVRAKANMPHKQLSAHAIACKKKSFRDQGGWGAEYVEMLILGGCPDTEHWPEKSMSRTHDTPETWENAKLYKADEVFMDLASPVYDRNLSYLQQLSIPLHRGCTVNDYNWQGHCTFGCDVVNGETQRTVTRTESGKLADMREFELMWAMNDTVTQGLGVRARNSWRDSYGHLGFYVLTGSKAVADNSIGILTSNA